MMHQVLDRAAPRSQLSSDTAVAIPNNNTNLNKNEIGSKNKKHE